MKPRRLLAPLPAAAARGLLILSALVVPSLGSGAEDRAPAPAATATPPAVVSKTEAASRKTDDTAPKTASPAAPSAAPGAPASAPAAAKPVAPSPLAPRFQQVRDRIKALYGHRDATPPPFDPRLNPFRTQPIATDPAPAAAATPVPPVAATPDTPPPPPVNQNAALLKQASALLKVTGFVEREGRIFLNINQALYKEGDVIKVTVQNQPVLLRATKVTRTALTLALNDAETTLRF